MLKIIHIQFLFHLLKFDTYKEKPIIQKENKTNLPAVLTNLVILLQSSNITRALCSEYTCMSGDLIWNHNFTSAYRKLMIKCRIIIVLSLFTPLLHTHQVKVGKRSLV